MIGLLAKRLLFCVGMVLAGPVSLAMADECTPNSEDRLIVPFINDVPSSARLLQTHRYGAKYIEIKSRPISLDHTLLLPYHKNVLLVGSLPPGQFTGAQKPDLSLGLKLPEPLAAAQKLIIGVQFSDGFVIAAKSGDWVFDPKSFVKKDRVAKSQITPEELALFDFGQESLLQVSGCNRYSLPEISGFIDKHGLPQKWFLLSQDSDKKPLKIGMLGLFSAKKSGKGFAIISGQVRFDSRPRPSVVKVLYENKEERTAYLSTDLKFSFLDEYPDQAMNIELVYGHDDRAYPNRGRWFGKDRPAGPLVIGVKNGYQNLSASHVDPKIVMKRGYRSRLRKNPIGYEGHVVKYWAGTYNSIQEFENWHFLNYNGFHDRDWDRENRSHCLRVAHIGQSIVQASQVRVSEKHSVLASERLSVQLGRCVEIASFASGLTPSSEPAIDWIMKQFKPDMLLFSVHRQMMQLATPRLASAVFGEDYGHAHFDTFEIKDNKLVYVPKDPKYYQAKKVKPQPYQDGIPTSLMFNLPFEVMPDIGLEAFKTLEGLMARYHQKYHILMGLEYSHTPAECKKASYCHRQQAVKGKSYKAGAVGFIKNMESLCAKSAAHCMTAAIPPDSARTYPDIVYQSDTHLTPRGNVWQAGILTRGLLPVLKKSMAAKN